MSRVILTAALAGSLLATPLLAETYHFDTTHTEVRFYYDHVGLSEQSGQWSVIEGTVEFDPENIAATAVNVTLDASSIDTGVGPLDTHLRSADFFDVENHPTITFVSTGVTQIDDETVTVIGDLTIKDTTSELSMTFGLNHFGPHPLGSMMEYFEGDWLGVSGTGELDRAAAGLETFAPMIAPIVRVEISAEMRAGGWE